MLKNANITTGEKQEIRKLNF